MFHVKQSTHMECEMRKINATDKIELSPPVWNGTTKQYGIERRFKRWDEDPECFIVKLTLDFSGTTFVDLVAPAASQFAIRHQNAFRKAFKGTNLNPVANAADWEKILNVKEDFLTSKKRGPDTRTDKEKANDALAKLSPDDLAAVIAAHKVHNKK